MIVLGAGISASNTSLRSKSHRRSLRAPQAGCATRADSTACSTCNKGETPTEFGWLTDLSALTEADAVTTHGALLCTVCFPSAPVEWTNFYETQAAAKKAARCPGSGTRDYPRETARMGYAAGNYGTCSHCGQNTTLTATNKLRGHKP